MKQNDKIKNEFEIVVHRKVCYEIPLRDYKTINYKCNIKAQKFKCSIRVCKV